MEVFYVSIFFNYVFTNIPYTYCIVIKVGTVIVMMFPGVLFVVV